MLGRDTRSWVGFQGYADDPGVKVADSRRITSYSVFFGRRRGPMLVGACFGGGAGLSANEEGLL